MIVWEWVVDIVSLIMIALLAVALRWAAIQRAGAHREWAAHERVRGGNLSLLDWCVAPWAAAAWL